MNLEAATTKAGEQIVTRKYNQRTKDWDVKIITVKKKFDYLSVMMAKIFNTRKQCEISEIGAIMPLKQLCSFD